MPHKYRLMRVNVQIFTEDGELIKEYKVNLADDKQRRTFAEQMTSAYAAMQRTVVTPEVVIK